MIVLLLVDLAVAVGDVAAKGIDWLGKCGDSWLITSALVLLFFLLLVFLLRLLPGLFLFLYSLLLWS